MDIVRITINGYGCEINRGITTHNKKEEIEKNIDDIWLKDIFKKIEVKGVINEVGLINGDILIEVNDDVIIDLPLTSFECLIDSEIKSVKYPNTDQFVLTSIQHQEGVFCDTIFILDDTFQIDKLFLIKKDINNKVDNNIISSLYCDIYYDGELIPMLGGLRDLRMSKLYFENQKKNG